MLASRCFLSVAVALVAAAVFPGCVGLRERTDPTVGHKPPMPVVKPSTREAQPVATEHEIVARAIGLARTQHAAAAAREVSEVPDPGARLRLAQRVATELTSIDPAQGAAFAEALASGPAQAVALEAVAETWVRRNPEAALHWAAGLRDARFAGAARRAVFTERMRTDPGATLAAVQALPEGSTRDEMLLAAAAAWARHDPVAALAWLDTRPADEFKVRLTSGMAFEIAQTNPSRALPLADALPAGRNRWLLLGAIAQTWVAVDPKAALAWAQQLPAGEARDAALAGVDTGFGVPASRRVASAPRGTTPRIRGGAAAAAWDGTESPAFAAWLALQPPGLTRDEAVLEYVRQRGVLEPMAVGQWVASLPGGPTRGRAMEIFFGGLLTTSPEYAADWLRSLPRSDRSDEMIEQTARAWLLRDRTAAEAWLRQTTLPAYRQEQLLREAGL